MTADAHRLATQRGVMAHPGPKTCALRCPSCSTHEMNASTLRYWRTEYQGEVQPVCPRCYVRLRGLYGHVEYKRNGWRGREKV